MQQGPGYNLVPGNRVDGAFALFSNGRRGSSISLSLAIEPEAMLMPA